MPVDGDALAPKRPPLLPDRPPSQKRPRRLTWFDTVRDAWRALAARAPQRRQFALAEILDVVNAQWASLRGKEKKNNRWRKDITACIRSDTILARSADATDEWYVVRDLHYAPKPSVKKSQPVKKKDLVEEHAKPPDELLCRATIPAEWTAESFKPLRLSTFDKSPAIHFVGHPSLNTIKGHKGYRMVRATSPVCEGDWYFEAKLISYARDGAVRLGWSQRRSDPETPVGFDAYGYGCRVRTGQFVHAARVRHYAAPFQEGDVVGCRITLPDLSEQQKQLIRQCDQKWLHHRFINLLQGQPPPDCDIDLHGRVRVQFYRNGVDLGVPAFFTETDVADSRLARKAGAAKRPNDHVAKKSPAAAKRRLCAGHFYPSISLYGEAVVKANFGPDFWFPKPAETRPMCEAARDAPPPKPVQDAVDPQQKQPEDVKNSEGHGQTVCSGALAGAMSQSTSVKQPEVGNVRVQSQSQPPLTLVEDAQKDDQRQADADAHHDANGTDAHEGDLHGGGQNSDSNGCSKRDVGNHGSESGVANSVGRAEFSGTVENSDGADVANGRESGRDTKISPAASEQVCPAGAQPVVPGCRLNSEARDE